MSRRPPNTAEAVAALLRDLGPRLRRGGLPEEPRERFPTGIDAVDALLGGGFPRGRLCEIAGAVSSGRTSLALALLARATREGEVCAVVDAVDGFDPAAAEAAGVVLPRVLWARAPALRPALRGTERLLEAEGFGLVLLNLSGAEQKPAQSVFPRLARMAAGTNTALLVLGLARTTGTAAEIALETQATRVRFTGTPPLLEELEVEVRAVRNRTGPTNHAARIRLRATA